MILNAIRFIKVASKVATVAWAAKSGYDIYKKGKKVYEVYDKVKKTKDRVKKVLKWKFFKLTKKQPYGCFFVWH